jgi:hypothetical protein
MDNMLCLRHSTGLLLCSISIFYVIQIIQFNLIFILFFGGHLAHLCEHVLSIYGDGIFPGMLKLSQFIGPLPYFGPTALFYALAYDYD